MSKQAAITQMIATIIRRGLYQPWTPAKERAIAKLWRMHHRACVEG